MVLFLTVPTSALIACLAVPVTRAIYERGHFTAADTRGHGRRARPLHAGHPVHVGPAQRRRGLLCVQGREDADVRELRLDRPQPRPQHLADGVLGFLAFPLSTTLAAILNVGLLYALLPRKIGEMPLGPLAAFAGKLAVASAAGGGAAWLGNRLRRRDRDVVPGDRGERRRVRDRRAGRLLRRRRVSRAHRAARVRPPLPPEIRGGLPTALVVKGLTPSCPGRPIIRLPSWPVRPQVRVPIPTKRPPPARGRGVPGR